MEVADWKKIFLTGTSPQQYKTMYPPRKDKTRTHTMSAKLSRNRCNHQISNQESIYGWSYGDQQKMVVGRR